MAKVADYKIYLDDERTPKGYSWTVVRTFEEFKALIAEKGLPKAMSFDHDLGLDQPSGYEIAKWLIYDMGYDLRGVNINVHSANPVGGDNIKRLIENWQHHYDDVKHLYS